MRIDWEGLIVGFESRSHHITHFFDRETGDVEQALVKDAERHEGFRSNPRFLALPQPNHINAQRGWRLRRGRELRAQRELAESVAPSHEPHSAHRRPG